MPPPLPWVQGVGVRFSGQREERRPGVSSDRANLGERPSGQGQGGRESPRGHRALLIPVQRGLLCGHRAVLREPRPRIPHSRTMAGGVQDLRSPR